MAGAVMLAAGADHVFWGFSELTHGRLTGVTKILAALFLSPVIGFILGFMIHRLARFLLRNATPSVNKPLRKIQFLSAAGLAFAHGANDAQCAKKILKLEAQSDELRASHTLTLNESFATAIDRDDIYRGITSIDDILDYAKATVKLIHSLKIQPDETIVKMAEEIHSGTVALQKGYAMLGENIKRAKSEAQANATHRSERDTEKIYRKALVTLFDEERLNQISQEHSWSEISNMFRKRELYRHLSNAADHVSVAGEYLHNTIVKAI